MKKVSVLATITAMGIAGSAALPAQAADMNQVYDQLKTNGYAVIGGQVNSPEDLKNMITGLNDKYPCLLYTSLWGYAVATLDEAVVLRKGGIDVYKRQYLGNRTYSARNSERISHFRCP